MDSRRTECGLQSDRAWTKCGQSVVSIEAPLCPHCAVIATSHIHLVSVFVSVYIMYSCSVGIVFILIVVKYLRIYITTVIVIDDW